MLDILSNISDLSMYFPFCQDKPDSRCSDSCRKFSHLFRLSGLVPKFSIEWKLLKNIQKSRAISGGLGFYMATAEIY